MFKAVLYCTLILLAAAYASHYEEFDNYIDYGDRQFDSFAVPYVYKPPKHERVVVEKVSPYLGDGQSHVLVPADLKPEVEVTEVEVSKLGLVSTVVSCIFGLIKKGIHFILGNIGALILGTLAALGVCNFTPICGKLSAYESLVEVQREIRSLATPERVASATEFVQNAIRKYRSLQDAQ